MAISTIQAKLQRALTLVCQRLGTAPKSPFDVQRQIVRTPEPTILDIGAHIGDVARSYRQLFPDALIHCHEPFPDSYEKLTANLLGQARTICHKTAMSDSKGTATLNANCSAATNSLLKTDDRASSYWGPGLLDTQLQIAVPTTTVDQFCAEFAIDSVQILKMDVQGAEFAVLRGAKEMLRAHKISVIYTELIICPTYQGQHKFHEYLSFLDSFGYDPLDFYSPVRKDNQLIQVDALFLSETFRKQLGLVT